MVYSDNALNVLTAKTFKGVGRAWVVKNLGGNETISTIVSLLNDDDKVNKDCPPIKQEDFQRNKEKIKHKVLLQEGFADGVVAIGDENFPPHRGRGKVNDSAQPVALFYRGNLSLLKVTNKNVAVIGLLNPDISIEEIEQEVVSELVRMGATIISGLALGCDSIAHEQALSSNGKTVAILPGPLDNILPSTNKELSDEIVKNKGLLITEYYENAKSRMELRGRYVERDRLQALFSDSIILAASYAENDQGNDFGSMWAMKYALDYSILRAIIYDSSTDRNNPKYALNRQLKNEQRDITVVDRKNLISRVEEIMLNGSKIQNEQQYKQSSFGLS